jgi:hypothetical protein
MAYPNVFVPDVNAAEGILKNDPKSRKRTIAPSQDHSKIAQIHGNPAHGIEGIAKNHDSDIRLSDYINKIKIDSSLQLISTICTSIPQQHFMPNLFEACLH